jgi:predicted transcriptional regulator
MHATTLKLPTEAKKAIDELSEKQGISSHRFMVEAVLEGIERARRDAAFVADSEAALNGVLAGKPVYSLDSVERYAKRKATGREAKRPVGQRWQK